MKRRGVTDSGMIGVCIVGFSVLAVSLGIYTYGETHRADLTAAPRPTPAFTVTLTHRKAMAPCLDGYSTKEELAARGLAEMISDAITANGGPVNIILSAENATLLLSGGTNWLDDWGITYVCVVKVGDGREIWHFEAT